MSRRLPAYSGVRQEEQAIVAKEETFDTLKPDYELLASIFKAMGNPVRLKILEKTITEEFCVQDLGEHLDRSQPNISQHLGVLRDRGLVVPERRGKKVCYRPSNPRIADIIKLATEAFDEG